MKLKHGDLVELNSRGRIYWVVLKVTREDIAKRKLNASLDAPGLYLFSGYRGWPDCRGSALHPNAYCKMTGPVSTEADLNGYVINHIRGHRGAVKYLR